MKKKNYLINRLSGDISNYPLNYSLIAETDKKEKLQTISINLYDTDNYFDLSSFYKPISNI
jgi:hypothetical protein